MIGTVVSFCILLRHELVQCSLRCFESWKMGSEFEEVPVVIELGLCIMTLRAQGLKWSVFWYQNPECYHYSTWSLWASDVLCIMAEGREP